MVNYGNGKIYKIQPISGGEDGDVYIGSTTKQYLSMRMDTHRSNYKHRSKIRSRTTSFYLFEKYGVDNCIIVLLEAVNATSKDELHARERFHIESMNCVNKCIPTRTPAEYYRDNILIIRENHKLYYVENRDIRLKTRSEYYMNNKEEIKQKQSEKTSCQCGAVITRSNLNKHIKTIRHQTNLEKINNTTA